jgi:DNA-binding NarL/FixJ family response regulator
MTVRVLVVDDQEPFRSAAAAVVAATDGFQVVGSAASGRRPWSPWTSFTRTWS